jgi:phosphotransferase system HPr (HPr) family protein
LSQLAAKFSSEIWLELNGKRANAKSIMSVLALGAAKGSSLSVEVSGDDADKAIEDLCALIARGFDGA